MNGRYLDVYTYEIKIRSHNKITANFRGGIFYLNVNRTTLEIRLL